MAKEQVKTQTETRLTYPPRFNVIVYNDDFTPMAFVIQMLIDVFNTSLETAQDLTMVIHNDDSAVVGTYNYEIAEQKTTEATAMARLNGHPLKINFERIE
jgi:ATP-dependent Clp protease adaptor protein ClpS